MSNVPLALERVRDLLRMLDAGESRAALRSCAESLESLLLCEHENQKGDRE